MSSLSTESKDARDQRITERADQGKSQRKMASVSGIKNAVQL